MTTVKLSQALDINHIVSSRSLSWSIWQFWQGWKGVVGLVGINNNYAADLGSLFGNIPKAGSERSMTNQVEKVVTPPDEEISPLEAWLEEFLSGETGETGGSFCGDTALV